MFYELGRVLPRMKGKPLIFSGLFLMLIFFLLAPRSPITPPLKDRYGEIIDGVDVVIGLFALTLLLGGYILYQYESYPKNVANYNVSILIVLFSWIVAANYLKNHCFPGTGVLYLLGSLAVTSPIPVFGYMLFVRKYERKRFVLIYVEKKERSENREA